MLYEETDDAHMEVDQPILEMGPSYTLLPTKSSAHSWTWYARLPRCSKCMSFGFLQPWLSCPSPPVILGGLP